MTKREIRKTETGSVYEYEESAEERAARIEAAAREAAKEIRLTAGQLKVLKRVRARARQGSAA